MAYAAERLVFPQNFTKLPDNPYNVINEITKYYYKPLYNNFLVQFALCELSLTVSTSIDFYIQCLNKIKTNNIQTHNLPNLINFLSTNLNAEFRNGNIVYRIPFMNAYIIRTKKLLDKYKTFFKLRIPDLYLWLQNVLLSCCILRNTKTPITFERILPITFFIQRMINNQNIITSYITTIGCPCIITETGYFNFPQKIFSNDLIYFPLYNNTIEYLACGNDREKCCAFYKFCKNKNWNCTRRTFKNIKSEQNCYYANLAKRFKIPYYLH